MKSEHSANQDHRLDQTLRAWVVTEELPPRFRDRVWQRIMRRETEQPLAATFWREWRQNLGLGLRRPSFAVVYVSVLLLTGLVAGYWQARAERNQTLHELSSRYVRMVDPYQTRH